MKLGLDGTGGSRPKGVPEGQSTGLTARWLGRVAGIWLGDRGGLTGSDGAVNGSGEHWLLK